MTSHEPADICLVLEGTYPFVTGGVSTWTHDLIQAQGHLTFHLLVLVPPGPSGPMKYTLPSNVVGLTRVELQNIEPGPDNPRDLDAVMRRLETPLLNLMSTAGSARDIQAVIDVLRSTPERLGRTALLESRAAWRLLERMYEAQCPHTSFLEYFWTWRSLLLGLYSVLLAPLVPARIYHALCTGYAGLYAARAHVATNQPAMLTEHGIYTNERRVEITLADWLQKDALQTLSIDRLHRDLRDLWIDTFTSYSRACYDACARVITLYEGNVLLQLQDGADQSCLSVIPNGIPLTADAPERVRPTARPTIALIGRVVPIKDIKTFLRACALVRESIPDVAIWILGPVDEDLVYADECRRLAAHLHLESSVDFKGKVALSEYYPLIDLVVLTSVSEAQPLVILEGAAAGIPSVATDVGACREMILGRADENPPLGPAGAVTPLASPMDTAAAIIRLLTDADAYRRCSATARARVRASYDKAHLDAAYRGIYETHLEPIAVEA